VKVSGTIGCATNAFKSGEARVRHFLLQRLIVLMPHHKFVVVANQRVAYVSSAWGIGNMKGWNTAPQLEKIEKLHSFSDGVFTLSPSFVLLTESSALPNPV
jgi:hypothetical protein